MREDAKMDIQFIPLSRTAGIDAVAFTFKSVLRDWGKEAEALAGDSTCTLNLLSWGDDQM